MNWLDDWIRQNMPIDWLPAAEPPDAETASHGELLITKNVVQIEVSEDLLMDCGVIPDTRPPRKPPTRRERFRWWRAAARERAACWAYRRIAGYDVPESDY